MNQNNSLHRSTNKSLRNLLSTAWHKQEQLEREIFVIHRQLQVTIDTMEHMEQLLSVTTRKLKELQGHVGEVSV